MAEQDPSESIANSNAHHLRVCAGPGTGKSFSMKKRIERILLDGASPKRVLVVTFTRATARDLQNTLAEIEVEGATELAATTLHSLAFRLLHQESIASTFSERRRVIADFELEPLFEDLAVPSRSKLKVRKLLAAYGAIWARLQDQEPRDAVSLDETKFEHDLMEWLTFHHAMLVDELIPRIYRHLEDNPAQIDRNRYSHVLVDEFQDLNKAEQSLIEILAGQAQMTIVGDEDQSIYSFRHAHPEGIRCWTEGKSGFADISLADCYRCPTDVVTAVNKLISYTQRPDRNILQPVDKNGKGMIHVWQFWMSKHEADQVVREIECLVDSQSVSPAEILVLVRDKQYGKEIDLALTKSHVTHRSFLAEATTVNISVRHQLQILSLLVDRDDRIALRWLLGEKSSSNWYTGSYKQLQRVCSKQSNLTPWVALTQQADKQVEHGIHKRLIEQFISLRDEVQALEELESAQSVVNALFGDENGDSSELREIAQEIINSHNAEENHSQEILRSVCVAIRRHIAVPEERDANDAVRLMTLHKSKGLSAPFVFILGCINGILPSNSSYDPEEERRLMYVGTSRVKASPEDGRAGVLVLTRAKRFQIGDTRKYQIDGSIDTKYRGLMRVEASPFIQEMGLTTTYDFRPKDDLVLLSNATIEHADT